MMSNKLKIPMARKTAFIGHRNLLPSDIEQRLEIAIQKEIDLGCKNFVMGNHGNFDRAALRACKNKQRTYPDLKIQVAITRLPTTRQDFPQSAKVELVMYEIEELHYKQQITASNRQMVDTCDTLIGYVRPQAWRSGAKTIMNYAVQKGLKIVNLYTPNDG